jgi:hypothetical protein
MKDQKLHIVSFDVPFPPDYGGVIDVFYKIKTLHEEGVKIFLHCFEYGRGKQNELKKYCEKIYYYKRNISRHLLFNSLPYIVSSRSSEKIITNLLKDNEPILFEGLHCCFYLKDSRLARRKRIVRMHNIEHDYYASLALVEKNFFRKRYFESETKKLQRFESVLESADAIAAISTKDARELSHRYKNVINIMPFHPHNQIEISEGTGSFSLYHGSLTVGENNKAALYLVNEIFNDINLPLIIAGKGASAELRGAINKKENISLHENVSAEEIYSLIKNAQINILPTFQATGLKLKLLSALYLGRHCIVNSPMVAETGLESLCHVAESADEMKKEISRLMKVPFNDKEKLEREKILRKKFSNRENVRKLIQLLF